MPSIVDEEMSTAGVNVSFVGESMGDTSSNSDMEMEGETATGLVGGTDAMVIT